MMRLVTQNGYRDVPYDSYIVSADDGYVFADNVHHEGKWSRIVLGVYCTLSDALSAVEEMHMAYDNGVNVFRFPSYDRPKDGK